MALWGASGVGILFGYLPPKRRTKLMHLSWLQTLGRLDFVGSFLLTAGVVMLVTGLNLGGTLYSWTNARTLSLLIVGCVALILFGIFEKSGTRSGILHHDLFNDDHNGGRWRFGLFCLMFFVEGAMFFGVAVWYPTL
jgi:hypothetical protein